MKISYSWLGNYIKLTKNPDEVSKILTNIGLEVEGIETFEELPGGLKGFVVGEVITCAKHPNADKLSVAKVNIGKGAPLDIVCGAPNVAAGQKVIVATIGSQVGTGDKGFTINKTKIRDEVSEGMICAEDEMGMGSSHEGILVLDASAVPGTPAAEYFNITSDTVFEIGLTPNRIDAASHYGTARDLAAFLSQHEIVELKKPDISGFKIDDKSNPVDIIIEDPLGCRRFAGVTISGVKVSESPKWLQNKLKAIGSTPINNVVDITNFVLHELGQPLHAYDADILHDNKIVVKRLPGGTKFITLDEVERKLSDQDVMVCDGKVAACIAGVFGGHQSGVSGSTKNIFLESAYFDPVSVRKTARRHDLNTDASFRFERGVDPDNTLYALKRAAMLIKELAGGRISSDVMDVYPSPIEPITIDMLYSHIDRLIGKKLDHDVIKKIMLSLDITVLHEEGDKIKVKVPPYRVDVTREADVIEEILRIYGYNNVEFSEKLNSSVSYLSKPDNESLVNILSDYLSDNGFHEIICNSLTKEDYYKTLQSFPGSKLVHILNPLSSDLNVMRQTLLFGGLEVISRNTNYKKPDLRLYEYGRVYFLKEKDISKIDNYNEISEFGLFITGNKEPQSWAVEETSSTFYQLKAYCLNLLKKAAIDEKLFSVKSLEDQKDIFSGGLEYSIGNDSLIHAGVINREITAAFNIEDDVFFAEIKWGKLIKYAEKERKFAELPKYPEVRRDLALLIDENVEYSQVEKIAYNSERNILKRINLFDYYKGKNIPEGKKSYAVSFFLQDFNKTLTDKEIDRIMNKIRDNLIRDLKAELR